MYAHKHTPICCNNLQLALYIRTCIYTLSTVAVKHNTHVAMLQWFTQPAVAERVTAGGPPVSVNEICSTAESLPDEAVDADLGHLRTCFSEVAWVLVTSMRKLIH